MQSLLNTAKYCLIMTLTTVLSPVLYVQGKRVKAKVPRMPEASQPWGKVTHPSEREVRLLTIGESTIAGVGVQTHEEGFSGTLADNIARRLKANLDWRVYAKNGATAKITVDKIIPTIPQRKFDLVVIGLGANDAFSFRSPQQWGKQITRIITALKNKLGDPVIVFSSMPPIQMFPAFPRLIRFTMGSIAVLLGNELDHIVTSMSNVHFHNKAFLPAESGNGRTPRNEIQSLFSDGVHPSK